jgi:hypothetical protein
MYALGVTSVWLAVVLAENWIEVPSWAWRAIAGVLGVGWICLYDPSHWWLGVGIGGAAVVLAMATDLLMVLTDWVRVQVLNRTGPRRPL